MLCSWGERRVPTQPVNRKSFVNLQPRYSLPVDHSYLTVTSTTRAALPLNQLYLLCSWAQYPVAPSAALSLPAILTGEMWAAAEVSDSAVGTLIELWLTCCHGNSRLPTTGQKCFLSPCTTQTARMKRPGSRISVLISFCRGRGAQTQMNFGDSRLVEEACE